MKNQWKSLFLLATALAVVMLYALFLDEDITFDVRLTRANVNMFFEPCDSDNMSENAGLAASRRDSLLQARQIPDTPHQRVMFIGASMLEGLTRRLVDYTEANGHELHTVVWYSSSSKQWAETDTLQHFMRKVKPTYIIVCLCGNELFVHDLDQRDRYIKTILQKIGDTPYVWVSPPNWKPDTGINDVIIRNVGASRYFDSRNLQLERGKDHAHPTFSAAALWADTIARWLRSPNTLHPIRLDDPTKKAERRDVTLLMPSR